MNTYHEHVLGRLDALNEPLILAAAVCLDALGAGERYEDLGGHDHELDVILEADLELEHCRIEGVVLELDVFLGQF